MKRRRLILFGALALIAAGVVALWPRGPKEPVYQGKKLTRWIGEYYLTTTKAEKEHAATAIRSIGTNALPYLLYLFERSATPNVTKFNSWMEEHTDFDLRLPDAKLSWRTAGKGIYVLGSNATDALPVLAGYLAEEERGTWAAFGIGGVGESALPFLLKTSESTNNAWAIYHALDALGGIAQSVESAIPHLIRFLDHTNETVLAYAAYALGKSTLKSDVVVPALIRKLSDRKAEMQAYAALVLGRRGKDAAAAVPHLLPLLQSPDLRVKTAASNALQQIDPTALPR